jgi:hypothetical protein
MDSLAYFKGNLNEMNINHLMSDLWKNLKGDEKNEVSMRDVRVLFAGIDGVSLPEHELTRDPRLS